MDAIVKPDVSALSLEERASLTAGRTMFSTARIEAIDLRPVHMADGPMGVASIRADERDISVMTPCGTALAASWDLDLVRRIGALVGEEARRMGVQVLLAPNLGIPRSPLAGRAFETFSEDPFLTGAMGAAWVEGIQSQGVGACVKHLVCNDSETQRDHMNAVVDDRALREVYLLPFEMAVKTGAWGVLMAYNKVNGTHCVEHPLLINDILKTEWGFDGFVVSDWFGTFDTARSAKAGLDLEMPGPARVFGPALAKAVAAGEVDGSRLDDAAERIVRLAGRVGSLGQDALPATPSRPDDAINALLVEAAAAGFVLLKNRDTLLPVDPSTRRTIAVIGPNATAPCYQGGTFAKIGLRPGKATPLEAIQARFGDQCDVVHAPGVDPQPRLPSLPAKPIQDRGDGDLGMTVAYFAGHDFAGEPLAVETRNTNSLAWFGALPGVGPMDREAGVRASGVFTPADDGLHRFYVGGTGSVRLRVDGEVVFAKETRLEPKDMMGALKSGVADTVEVTLQAGVAITVEAELLTSPGRAQGLWYGVRPPGEPDEMLAQAVSLAKTADVVFLVVGETPDAGVESIDRPDTLLTARQIDLIHKVTAANPSTVVIVNAAHAVDLTCADNAAAVMMTWYPGEAFGVALAKVLAGDLEPGGRLPISFAQREADYPAFDLTPDAQADLVLTDGWLVGYRGFQAKGKQPRHAFGEGLGYGAFAYEAVRILPRADGGFDVEVDVRNIGARAAKAVVQVYVSAVDIDNPILQLKGFDALKLSPGQTSTARTTLDLRAFSHWAGEAGWTIAPGRHAIHVGSDVGGAQGYDFVTPQDPGATT
jgi:beta-glucosidase